MGMSGGRISMMSILGETGVLIITGIGVSSMARCFGFRRRPGDGYLTTWVFGPGTRVKAGCGYQAALLLLLGHPGNSFTAVVSMP